MKLYIVTLKSYNGTGDNIIKVFSDKETLDRWIVYADQMEKELFGDRVDPTATISKQYRIKECDLDSLAHKLNPPLSLNE